MGDGWKDIGTILNLFFKLIVPLMLLVVTWVTQHCMIRARRKYLAEREAYYRERILLTNLKQYPAGECFAPSLVTGAVVIASNYFVAFVSAFKHLFGGRALPVQLGMQRDLVVDGEEFAFVLHERILRYAVP